MNEDQLKKRVSELEAEVKELEKDLLHDSLTGLKTRTFFEEEVSVYLSQIASLKEGKRRDWFGFKNLSILFFDIDHFKKVNDNNGHSIGDLVLKKVAETITKSLRVGDTIARYGGEEIVASLLGANESDAKSKAEEVRKNIESLVFENNSDLKVTISVGVATNFPGADCESLLKRADKALYKAKEGGRNKVVAYSELGE